MDIDAPDEDAFEDVRDRVESPMRRLFAEYGRENRFAFGVGLGSSVVARILDLLPPLLLAVAIDAVIQQRQPFGLWVVPDGWLPGGQTAQLWLVGGVIAATFLFAAVFHYARNWGWNAFAQHVQHAVRTDTYEEMQRLNMDFFAEKQTGEMMSVLSNDVNRLEEFLNEGLNSAFRLAVMVVGIAGILLWMNWQLALVALLPVPLIAFFTKRFIEAIQPKYAAVRASVGTLNSRLENNLGGIQVIKAAHTEDYEADRVDDSSREYLDANWDAIETRITFFPGLRLISGVGFVITFVVGGLWVIEGAPGPFTLALTEGQFVAFILYTQRFIWPMAQFGQIINTYQRAYASAERVFGLMDAPSRIVDAPDAEPLRLTEGRVEYDDVSFSYGDWRSTVDGSLRGGDGRGDGDDRPDDGGAEPVLGDVSFEVPGGETLALVGPTGAGKSTVVKLLLRLYDVSGPTGSDGSSDERSESEGVDEGAIRVDGQDVRDVTLPSLRQAIGYVSQDTFLFSGTVRENVAYGSFDASDEAVVEAAKAAEAHAFVRNLPDGYDTKVGERGVKLSGGQRQRIAIARAVLKDPDVLVLDEATSDVDTETEMLIQRSLDRLTADRTTFVIAHRLSTVKDADQIVVLEDGTVAERGTHDELIEADGLYASLWAVQAGELDELPEEFVRRAIERRARTDADD